MGGNRLELEKECDRGDDRISKLPDDIIVDVITLLSLKEAVCTSLVSSRWSNLWKHIPNLNLDTVILAKRPWLLPEHAFTEWVNSVCNSHQVLSLKRLRIRGIVDNSDQCAVTKWLEHAAISQRLEALELALICVERKHSAVLDQELLMRVSCGYKCLKELSLITFLVSGEAIRLLLQNCPLLERLIIDKAILTSHVEVRGGALNYLDMNHCQGGKSITVAAPNLAFLRVNTRSDLLLLENVPQLVEASFTFKNNRNEVDDPMQRFRLALFGCFSQLQTLTIALFSPKIFLASRFPDMSKLKKLKVYYSGVYEEGLMPVPRLIWASPFLVEFHLEWLWNKSVEEGEFPPNIARFHHRHLKVLEISRCPGTRHVKKLVYYILNGCIALEKIIAHPIHPFSAKYVDFLQRLEAKLPPHIQLLYN